ncbi:MAG: peptidylprolyl isomerase [Planctomycetota bacterium]
MIENESWAEATHRSSTTGPESHSPSQSRGARLLREPLLHFLLLGAALFALYGFLNRGERAAADDRQIVVSEGKIKQLAALFTRTWQRPPTSEELAGLVNDYIREEAAYREGTALGLDRNDTIVRRRIRQKLDFVADDLATQLQPSDEDLEKYLKDHQDKFRVAARLSFRQVFFDPERHGEDLAETINDVVVRLQEDRSVNGSAQGDRTLLEFGYADVSQREIANLFGEQFAAAVVPLEPGAWQGPIASSYGQHVVIVDALTPGELPALENIRDVVRREWEHARRQELTDKYYEGLLDKYDVVVKWPPIEAE